ncbi:MAG TPA: hypothetical protein VME66_11195 [Candidatus Acidoferrales bacterium]|nr:hypothetical protein [Candidatus Acidoferrales bacterium]
MMRERIPIYAALAVLCAIAGTYGAAGLVDAVNRPDVQKAIFGALLGVPGLRAVLLASVLALFFILPSALRRVRPEFRMTPTRVCLTIVMLGAIGLATDIGLAAMVVPGVVIGVLASQALFSALLADRPANGPRVLSPFAGAFARSLALTKAHFISTLGVVALSLAVLLIPFMASLFGALVLIGWDDRTLVVTAPLLLFVFVYFECVRYAIIVRWYERLAERQKG